MSIILEVALQVLGFIFRTILPYLLCFIMGWYCCNKWHERSLRPRPGYEHTVTERVVKVAAGNQVVVKGGIFHRGGLGAKKTRNVDLWGIEIPAEVSDQARQHLSDIVKADDMITVRLKDGGRLGNNDITGIVTNNGVNCNLLQLRDGLARTNVSDKEFVAAQDEAKKAQRGIWKENKKPDDRRPHFPWWRDTE